jgi:hypothetical protein
LTILFSRKLTKLGSRMVKMGKRVKPSTTRHVFYKSCVLAALKNFDPIIQFIRKKSKFIGNKYV